MATTVRLVPSNYGRSNTNYVTVTDDNNMYANTDSTTYGSFRGRGGRSSNSTYYGFLNGFNFSAVPDGATVTSFEVKIKCYRNSYQNTGSSYRLRLASSASNNSVISGTTTSTDIGISVGTITIPTGNLTWATLSGYGANFSIEIPLRNTSTTSSNYPYVYVYGAEITVTYEEGVTPSSPVRVKNNGSWVTPSKVLVKNNGSWVEGTVKVKSGGTWH